MIKQDQKTIKKKQEKEIARDNLYKLLVQEKWFLMFLKVKYFQ